MARKTLADVFADAAERNRVEAAERDEWLKTPDGIAWAAEQARLVAADQHAWEERTSGPFECGRMAATNEEEREAPAELDAKAQAAWLAGYDEELAEDDEA